jgi:hypothetical protein
MKFEQGSDILKRLERSRLERDTGPLSPSSMLGLVNPLLSILSSTRWRESSGTLRVEECTDGVFDAFLFHGTKDSLSSLDDLLRTRVCIS